MTRTQWRRIVVHKCDTWLTAPQYIPALQRLSLMPNDPFRIIGILTTARSRLMRLRLERKHNKRFSLKLNLP